MTTSKLAAGALWMVSFKILERSLGLIGTVILARVLIPADFGLVAMAMAAIALLEIFASFGMDTVLIQRLNATRSEFDTAWTLNVLAGGSVALVLLLLAGPLSALYREPALLLVLCALSAGAGIQGFENIGVVSFRKRLEFRRKFHFLLTKKLATFAITVPLALLLRSYWALVIGTVAGRTFSVVYSYFVDSFRPRFSLVDASRMLHFSKWLVALNALTFLKQRSATFFLGLHSGPAAVGAFSVAEEIASLPGTELVAPINRAALPTYATIAHDPSQLGDAYIKVMAMIALIAVPAVAGVALAAPFLVPLVLGPKWVATTPLLEILAFFGITQVLQTNAYAAFLALGRPRVFAIINAVHVAMLIAALAVLTPTHGALGAAWAYLIASMAALPVIFVFVTRHLGLRPARLAAVLWRPVVAASIMYASCKLIGPSTADVLYSPSIAFRGLLSVSVLGAGTYVLVCGSMWLISGKPEGAEAWVSRFLRGRMLWVLRWARWPPPFRQP